MTTIPADEDMLIVKCSFMLTSMGKQKTIKLSETDLRATLNWLLNAIRINLCVGLCDILRAVEALLKSIDSDISQVNGGVGIDEGWENSERMKGKCKRMICECQLGGTEFAIVISPRESMNRSDKWKYDFQIADCLVSTDRGILMIFLTNPTKLHDKSLNYENCLPSEILLSTVSCLKTLLNSPIKIDESDLNEIMQQMHNLIFKNAAGKFSETNYCVLMAAALNICRQICTRDRQICGKFIGENIGAAKAFLMFGLTDVEQSFQPQKVNVSQQTVEPVTFNANKGGKVPKARKPGTMFKGRKKGNKTTKTSIVEESHFRDSDNDFNVYHTTDSDSADPTRHKQSVEMKLRLNALSLVGVIGRLVDTKALFGYWHTLFPSDIATPSTVSLLNAAVRDPSARCRIAALQAATIILHGSKPFLSQVTFFFHFERELSKLSVVCGFYCNVQCNLWN